MDSGPKFTGLVSLNAEGNRSRSHVFPILDIFSHSGDIRDQSLKLCKIGRNFCIFLAPKFFTVGPPEFLDLLHKIDTDIDHVAVCRGDRPAERGDPLTN